MLLVRNLLYWLLVLVTTPIFFTLLLLAAPLPRRKRHVIGQSWARLLTWALWHIVGLRYRVIGAENITTEPGVICAKHQSGWETLSLQQIFPSQIFVAKQELLWIPFFGWGLALMNPITINRSDRSNANRRMQQQGLNRKQHGFWISVFPEGTRVRPGLRASTSWVPRAWRASWTCRCCRWRTMPVNSGRAMPS